MLVSCRSVALFAVICLLADMVAAFVAEKLGETGKAGKAALNIDFVLDLLVKKLLE